MFWCSRCRGLEQELGLWFRDGGLQGNLRHDEMCTVSKVMQMNSDWIFHDVHMVWFMSCLSFEVGFVVSTTIGVVDSRSSLGLGFDTPGFCNTTLDICEQERL